MDAPRPTRRLTSATLALATVVLGGCAGLPRIDPSGQRLLIWPGEPAPVATLPGAPLPALAVPTPTFASPPPANVTAAPVYTDPYLPGAGPTTPASAIGPTSASTVNNQPRPGALTISPQRLLAPVGSEVILRANLCDTDGYLQANRRVEWMLDRRGVGEFVTLGERGQFDLARLPWQNPKKVDNYYAIGVTSPFYQCLDRGTADGTDDLQSRRGDAWISVSSPVEGTSYVTAFMPSVDNWNDRTARATIYWVDAEWTFPASVTLAPGERHTLTTTVTRQSDGTPLAGWIVRYVVQGGGAALGYDAGTTSEVRTDASGRASVEVTPTDSNPGTTSIAVEVVRPEQTTIESSPRVTLGNGVTTLTWASGGVAGTPLPPSGPGTSPIFTPPSDTTPIPGGTTPPPATNPTGRADLDLQAAAVGTGPFTTDGTARFDASLINRGNAPARINKITVEFDPGLKHAAARPGEPYIKIETPFTLGPGESETLPPLDFQIVGSGRQCINIKIDSDAPVSPVERVCIDVAEPAAPVRPVLNVVVDGPLQHRAGETAQFKIVVRNTSDVTATNVVVAQQSDAALKPIEADPPMIQLDGGLLGWNIGSIEPGGRRELFLNSRCEAASTRAAMRVEVTASPDVTAYGEKAFPILPPIGGELGSTPPPATTPAQDNGVPVTLNVTGGTRVGVGGTLFVNVKNNTNQTQRNVQLRVLVPPQFQANVDQIQSQQQAQFMQTAPGLEIRFAPLASLAPGQSINAAIPLTAVTRGTATIYAERVGEGLPALTNNSPIEVMDRL